MKEEEKDGFLPQSVIDFGIGKIALILAGAIGGGLIVAHYKEAEKECILNEIWEELEARNARLN